MVLEDGPLRSAFERDTKGIVKQEFITYVINSCFIIPLVSLSNADLSGPSSSTIIQSPQQLLVLLLI